MRDLKSTIEEFEKKAATHPILAKLWTTALLERAMALQRDIRIANDVLRDLEQSPDINMDQLRALCLMYGCGNTA